MDTLKSTIGSIKSKVADVKSKYSDIMRKQQEELKKMRLKTEHTGNLAANIKANKYFNDRMLMVSIMYQNDDVYDEQGYMDFVANAHTIYSFLNANGITLLLTTRMIQSLKNIKNNIESEDDVFKFVEDYDHKRV
jgi:hypothetical protein